MFQKAHHFSLFSPGLSINQILHYEPVNIFPFMTLAMKITKFLAVCIIKFSSFSMFVYIGFKTFFYVFRHLDSTASYLPTGLHLGFFRSWPSLFLQSSFSSVFLVFSFVSASTSKLVSAVFLLPLFEHGHTM